MKRIEMKYFSYCKISSILGGNQTTDRPKSTMNSKTLLHSVITATFVSAVLFGVADMNINLPLVGTVVSYVAAVMILALAAFDGVKRNS